MKNSRKEDKRQTQRPKSQNIRVYELAKQYEMSSRDLVEELQSYGVPVKNHMSTLDPDMVDLVESERSSQNTEPEEPEARVPAASETADPVPETQEALPEKKEPVSVTKEEVKEEDDETPAARSEVSEGITVGELAPILGFKGTELIMRLMKMGIMASINQRLNYETLQVLSEEFNFEPIREPTLEEQLLKDEPDNPEELMPRAPVVTIMGHVDHGKTSLLDAIRESNVMDTEAGNITQHIGAYHVELNSGNVVFLDTPGHAAFTAMRARGAQVTDIVVLVIAADDGVMPQTIEAVNHAKAAMVPIVVAINKIDVDGAQPDRVKQQLSDHDLVPEEWGGQTIFVEVSAKEREGIDFLLEMLLLEAELLDLKANPNKYARGTIIEAELDKGRGAVVTVLVQSGTLKVGDSFIAGRYSGKVRAMINDHGQRVKQAGSSTPVEVLGFTGIPEAGDRFYAIDQEKNAKAISETRQEQHRKSQLGSHSHVNLDDLFQQIQEQEIKELNVIVKGDVQGSVQAVSESLVKLGTNEVQINIIHQAVGGITETDILLASASNAIVLGFNIRPTTEAMRDAELEGIDVRTYTVIYDLISDVTSAMEGLLDPEVREVVIGRAVVRQLFKVPRVGTAAGSYVNWGRIVHNHPVRVLRDNRLIYEGQVDSLRRFKDNVSEVAANYECGIGINTFSDFKTNDILECYTYENVPRTLR